MFLIMVTTWCHSNATVVLWAPDRSNKPSGGNRALKLTGHWKGAWSCHRPLPAICCRCGEQAGCIWLGCLPPHKVVASTTWGEKNWRTWEGTPTTIPAPLHLPSDYLNIPELFPPTHSHLLWLWWWKFFFSLLLWSSRSIVLLKDGDN